MQLLLSNPLLQSQLFTKLSISLKNYDALLQTELASFNDTKKIIFESMEENIEEAKNCFNQLKEKYPNEDYIQLEEALKAKEEQIAIEKEEAARLEAEEKALEEAAKLEAEKILETENNIETSSITSSSESHSSNTVSQPKIAYTSVAANSSQLITVVSTGGSSAELTLWQKDSSGNWFEYDSMFARLGSGGMKSASLVYEMDMCTPTGIYSLSEAFGINSNPGSGLPYRVLDGSEYWVDDENSPYYNTMQFGEPNGRWSSAEHLSSMGRSYYYSIVVDYNRWPVIPGKSSAIFLHVDVGVPTWGCIAVEESKMVKILNWISSSANPKIILDFSYDNIYNNY
nr:L,D-transpeptidase family protein [uncultured Clostridium sp.]